MVMLLSLATGILIVVGAAVAVLLIAIAIFIAAAIFILRVATGGIKLEKKCG